MLQLVYTPTLPPGCCFICRASIRDSYIDTGVTVDFDGTFYACNQCVGEMAEKYGYLSMDDYKDLRAAKEYLESLNFELIKRVGELERIHEALDYAGYKLCDDGSVARLGGYTLDSNKLGKEGASGTTVELGAGEGETTEPSDDEGMGILYADESSSDSKFSLDF